jgi:hypothetical protein
MFALLTFSLADPATMAALLPEPPDSFEIEALPGAGPTDAAPQVLMDANGIELDLALDLVVPSPLSGSFGNTLSSFVGGDLGAGLPGSGREMLQQFVAQACGALPVPVQFHRVSRGQLFRSPPTGFLVVALAEASAAD